MAVKRKASTLEAPNLKRRTRSSGAVVEPLDSLPATPTKVIRTYGSGRTRTVLAQTQRENEADILEGDEGSREIPHENSIDSESGSEDELMLSPSRPSRNARVTRTGTPSSRRVMESVEIITPSKRAPRIYPSRSSRNLSETPDSSSRLPSVQQSERSQTPEKSPHLTSPKMNMWAINPAASNARYVRPCLNMQKRAILRALQSLPDTRADEGDEDEEQPRNETVMQQLDDLLKATVTRGEGNSCLLLGPRGSGKSRIVERCIANVPQKPIIIRLSGWTEYNDRLAMREIAHQLFQQTGTAYNIDENDPDAAGEDSPFLDTIETEQNRLLLPPPSHLPALISTLPTLSRPTIVILDSFDLFALHPRQALLYCLLDTVQNCRAGSGRSALAVIGITSRLDTTNLLEKRVKSRFSGRTLRTAHPRVLNAWTGLVQEVLSTPLSGNEDNEEHVETWQSSWKANIETFIADDAVASLLREVFAVSKDIRLLRHLLMGLVLQLTEASPYPSASHLSAVISAQRLRLQHGELHALPYPSLCLLIACMHSRTAGHDTFTFEMLYERFIRQVRASTAAPVQVNGGSIGMVRCPRPVMMGAFEEFIASRIFVCVMPATAVVSKEFIKYRCTVEFDDLRKAVARTGHAHLKRWMNKPQ